MGHGHYPTTEACTGNRARCSRDVGEEGLTNVIGFHSFLWSEKYPGLLIRISSGPSACLFSSNIDIDLGENVCLDEYFQA